MNLKKPYALISITICLIVDAQINTVKINSNIVMPKDSSVKKALIFSLNNFLNTAQDNSENRWILPSERVENQILIDEILDIEKSKEFEDDSFFKPYLNNLIPLEENKY